MSLFPPTHTCTQTCTYTHTPCTKLAHSTDDASPRMTETPVCCCRDTQRPLQSVPLKVFDLFPYFRTGLVLSLLSKISFKISCLLVSDSHQQQTRNCLPCWGKNSQWRYQTFFPQWPLAFFALETNNLHNCDNCQLWQLSHVASVTTVTTVTSVTTVTHVVSTCKRWWLCPMIDHRDQGDNSRLLNAEKDIVVRPCLYSSSSVRHHTLINLHWKIEPANHLLKNSAS